MILNLKVQVPSSVDHDEALVKLLLAAAKEQGITITTAQQYQMDVDLVGVERGV